jgi:hypothetical protein
MGYITGKRDIVRTEIANVAAKCDKCGADLPVSHWGNTGFLELVVYGTITTFYQECGADRIRLLYCRKCADDVLDVLPGLKAALGIPEEEGEQPR